jgi:hypothetical protein
MKALFILLLAAILFVTACSKLESPDAVDPSQKLTASVSKTSMRSGGADSIHVIARVPKAAGIIDVTFTSSHGDFVYSASNTVKQLTDSLAGPYRYSVVLFKADTTTGIYYFTAEAGGQRSRTQINVSK